jgi:predicted ATPase/transcriptional regulator with XRE-family HTH domain
VSGPDAFESFGALLKHLRLRAGLTQRQLALAIGYHFAHVSRLEHNERLPDTATLLALFIPALGLENQPDWALRLLALAAAARGEELPRQLTQIRTATVETTQVLSLDDTPAAPGPVLSRVPVPLNPLLGRETELKAVRQVLLRPEVRLLTLLGPPGIGKTRLALEAAAELAGRFKHGAVFVDLSLALDPDAALAAVAAALEVPERAGGRLAEAVTNLLRDRHQLLVLDNFEQVLGAAPLVAGWLRAAPRLKILGTSREHLRVSGEHEFPVPPLAAPPASASLNLTDLASFPAVALFVERAQAIQPDFALSPANAAAVAELCTRLDGLPLALELAAARIKLLAPQAMQGRLDQRLAWLTHGAADGPAWRQTLRGAIDWSFNLLDPAEQRVFSALSIFAGAFTAPAAQAVAGASFDQLDDLVGKSLLQALPDAASGETRLRLLETLREYALERLRADPTHEAQARQSHADFFLALAQRCSADLAGPQQAAALRTLDLEYDNLTAALAWAEAHDPLLGLRLAGCLIRFWQSRGRKREGSLWFERLLALAPASPEAIQPRLRAMRGAGSLATGLGEYDAGRRWHEQALAMAQAAGDGEMIGNVLNSLAVNAHVAGRLDEALGRYFETLALRRAHGTPFGVSQTLNNIGVVLNQEGRGMEAEPHLRESLAIRQALNNQLEVAQSLHNLAAAIGPRDRVQAVALAEEALGTFRALNVRPGIVDALLGLADLALAAGNPSSAEAHLAEALPLSVAMEDDAFVGRCLSASANVAAHRARAAAGDECACHYQQMVRLISAADRHFAAHHVALTPREAEHRAALLAEARAALPPEAYTLETIAGAHMPL